MTPAEPGSGASADAEALIDITLEDSFPASDPPSWTTTIVGLPRRATPSEAAPGESARPRTDEPRAAASRASAPHGR